ncbi:hypothetical protein CPB84DRAFT_1817231 [Gymnopilus junonius]|uniref:Uncharacterized protein n=1 Tax=Gymnopilus junonius TaxID=109634 RepID=A0A9P5NEK1_GYMJU|nr:hypothetical protein CPB84DRAFT_1817231 [Gymnopilus junonius]
MRWSLILSTLVLVQSALSFLCVALAIPPSWLALDRRTIGAGPKASSKTYRKNSQKHAHAYKFDGEGVTREKLKPEEIQANGAHMIKIPHTDADHIFELQMFKSQLDDHKLRFDKLDPNLRKDVQEIINGADNVAPVPAKVNQSKGQYIKHALKGKDIKPMKTRDGYILLSYTTARRIAKRLDKVFKKHGHDFGQDTFRKKLRNTMENAKLFRPGEPSPAGSSRASSRSARVSDTGSVDNHSQPRHSPVRKRAKPKVTAAIRRSARIAKRVRG